MTSAKELLQNDRARRTRGTDLLAREFPGSTVQQGWSIGELSGSHTNNDCSSGNTTARTPAERKARAALGARQLEGLPDSVKRNRDGSANLATVGGPLHGVAVRIYPPWEPFSVAGGEYHPVEVPGGKVNYMYRQ